LARVEKNYQRRLEIWNTIRRAENLPLFLPLEAEPETKHGLHLFNMMLILIRLNFKR